MTAARLDAADPLASYRDRFFIPRHGDGESTYLCGNSLGLQPRDAARVIGEELEDWRTLAVEGHFRGRRPWSDYHALFAAPLAALTGAREHEVVCMNGLTVNLHLLMVSFFRPRGRRRKILIERPAFPSDRYAVVSQLAFHGIDPGEGLVEVAPRPGEHTLREADLVEAITDAGPELALALLPGVQYLSGEVLDMEALVSAARNEGATVGLDLAHAVGNVPLSLHDWGPDFAVWCSYKYLNGGPGAVAGAFVHERHAEAFDLPRFAGWWGHDRANRFLMAPDFNPIRGAEGWQLSNPPVLGMAPLLASLELFMEAGPDRLREKSVALTGFLGERIEAACGDAVEIITPRAPRQRGCQLSLKLTGGTLHGRTVFEHLERAGIVCDWREPDVIRVAPVPLYNRFADAEHFVEVLAGAVS